MTMDQTHYNLSDGGVLRVQASATHLDTKHAYGEQREPGPFWSFDAWCSEPLDQMSLLTLWAIQLVLFIATSRTGEEGSPCHATRGSLVTAEEREGCYVVISSVQVIADNNAALGTRLN
jgi:hypothetical protein